MTSALVTGATGLVGSHIVERLTRDGWRVRALVRSPSSELTALGVETVLGDVLDADRVAAAAAGTDVIFHTAAAVIAGGGWETFRRLNVDGTRNMIAAAARAGARLMHLSSVAVYGPEGRYRSSEKTDENTPLGPLPERAYYARSKRESEQLVLDAHTAGAIWATAVRPDVIYGPRDRQFIPRVAPLMRFGLAPAIGGGHSTLAIVHAANVADGAVLAGTSDTAGGQAYNLANDYDVTVRDFIRLAGVGLGRRMRAVPIPLGLTRATVSLVLAAIRVVTAGRMAPVSSASIDMLTRDNPFTSDRARRELAWSPAVHPEQGIPDAFRWWRTRASMSVH